MANKPKRVDWKNLPPLSPEFAAAALDRFKDHQERIRRTKLHDRVQRTWQRYYSRDKNANADMTAIQVTGEAGEVVVLQPNRFARLVRDLVQDVRQIPPNPEPVALNSDAESQAQVALAKGILDWYKFKEDLPDLDAQRYETALLTTESTLHVRWDPETGREYGVAGSKLLYEGDFVFSVGTLYDVAYDITSPRKKRPRWVIHKEPMDRWDAIAKFPDFEEAIMKADEFLASAPEGFGRETETRDYDDSIAVYYVYIERSPSRPTGRMALVLDEKTVLFDGPLAEARPGVFIMRPYEMMFRPEGHTAVHDGLPIAEAHGAVVSTIMTNADAHGLQKMLVARKANVKDGDVAGGVCLVAYDHVDPQTGAVVPEPKPMEPAETPQSVLALYEILTSEMDIAMGGSDVRRGQGSSASSSGAKDAMLYAAVQQVSNASLAALFRSDAEVFTHMIDTMRRRATVERVISIVGQRNTYTAKRFTGENLGQILRVLVRQADPMKDSPEWRLQVAERVIALPLEERQQMTAYLETGSTASLTEETEEQRLLIVRENELLIDEDAEEMPMVMPEDLHLEHFKCHAARKNSPEIRANTEICKRIDEHNRKHLSALTIAIPQQVSEPVIDPATGLPVIDPATGQPAVAMRTVMVPNPEFAGDDVLRATGQGPLPPQGESPPPEGIPRPDGKKSPPDAPRPDAHAAPKSAPAANPKMPKRSDTGEQVEPGGKPPNPQV